MTTPRKLTASVVIPAYNEEKNLRPTVKKLTAAFADSGIPYEIIIVNDNSVDGTRAVIRELMNEDPGIATVDRTPPRGFGRAVRAGLDAVTGDLVMLYMADASDDPKDAVRYYEYIEAGYDCVFGSRFMKGSKVTNYPPFKLVVNRIVNKCMQLLFWTKCNDLTNSFKAYRTRVIRECGPYRACHFNITIELSLSALIRNYNIMRIPISWEGRTWGSSNLHLSEMGRRYLSTLIKIYFEKSLILDDIIADSVQTNAARECEERDLAARVRTLEEKVAKLSPPPADS